MTHNLTHNSAEWRRFEGWKSVGKDEVSDSFT